MKKNLFARMVSFPFLTLTVLLLGCTAGFSQTWSSTELLIRFEPIISESRISSYKNSIGATEIAISPLSKIRLWSIPDFSVADNAYGWTTINEVVNGSGNTAIVNSVGFNYDHFVPSSDLGLAPTGSLDPIAACPEFSILCSTSEEQPVKVAILDTGIGYTGTNSNPVFCNSAVFNSNYGSFIGYDFVNSDAEPQDDQGHGTHIAGIIAQMASLGGDLDLELMSFKTHNYQGQGRLFDVILATDMAVMEGANIINMSFSYPANAPSDKPDPLQVAIEIAGEHGVLVVASAGNIPSGSSTSPSFYPASFDCENIISVTSVDCEKELSSFGAWGIPNVDIAILGENIVGPHYISGNMVLKSGTSQASAIVAGIAAQLASNLEDIHYEPLKCAILSGAESNADLTGLIVTEGVADAPKALQYLTLTCNPPALGSLPGTLTGNTVEGVSGEMLTAFPNPFTGDLSASFQAKQAGEVIFIVSNAQGSILYSDKKMLSDADEITFSWRPSESHTPGLYFTRIHAAGQTITKKVIKE